MAALAAEGNTFFAKKRSLQVAMNLLEELALAKEKRIGFRTEIDTGISKLTNGYLVDKRIASDYEKLKAAAESFTIF